MSTGWWARAKEVRMFYDVCETAPPVGLEGGKMKVLISVKGSRKTEPNHICPIQSLEKEKVI